jgi:hypothetical protein
LKIGQLAFQRKGDIIIQLCTDKRLVQVKSIIHDTTVVNAGRKDRTDLEIKKPYAVFQCIKFMKGIDRADQYLSYYSVLRKTVEWPNVSAKLCTFQSIFLYKTNTNNK